MKPRRPKPKQTIGMTDLVDFPDLNLFNIQAKVDTGAYTSSLYCQDVQLIESGNQTMLRFQVISRNNDQIQEFYSDKFSQRTIRNSFGVSEKRYVIKTRVVLFGRTIQTEFTLADREHLKNPVLLGRKLLRNRFIVDVSQKNLSYQAKAAGKRSPKPTGD
ncbi:RimK/LysX family protein [Spirosoma daeguense]